MHMHMGMHIIISIIMVRVTVMIGCVSFFPDLLTYHTNLQ